MNWQSHARWASIAWLGVAVFSGVMVWLSLQVDGSASDALFAGGVVAVIFGLYSCFRLNVSPSTGALLGSAIWAVLNLLLGVWQMASGATPLATVPYLLLIAAAGFESFQGWQGRRATA